jgi:hypothetical protein
MNAIATTCENRTIASSCFRIPRATLRKSELCNYAVSDTRCEFRSGPIVFAQALPGADRIMDALVAAHDAAARMIDTSIVRVHGARIADNNHQDMGHS